MASATFWTAGHLAAILHPAASPQGSVDAPLTPLAGVSIDTRTLRPGQVYVALRGENHDGHAFVDAALQAGAALAIVERDAGVSAPAVLRVPDTLAALQRLAWAYRDHLRQRGCRVIAVAGSNGKTTTRHMIHAILSSRLRGTQSPKSFNNHIGVPLTLLGAGEDDDFVVVEIGTNHPGEVAALARIVRPDAAVVTSIGHEHMEFFGTLDNVAKEEFSVFEHLEPGGLALVPASEAKRLETLGLAGSTFDDDPAVPADLPVAGAHNRRNAAAAAAVARWCAMRDPEIAAGLRALEPVPGRLERLTFGDVTVVHDAYNANPDSMREALHTLADWPARRRVAVVGDMLELGGAGPDLHRDTGLRIAALGAIDHVVTIGPFAMHTADALRDAPGLTVTALPRWTDDAGRLIAEGIEPGDVVLLKASRGMRLERLLPVLKDTFAPLAAPSGGG